MCSDILIEHRNDVCLTNANYFSRLGVDLCFDPLLKEYVQQVDAIRRRSPALTEMSIAPKHQPYFCGPHIDMLQLPQKPVAALLSHDRPAVATIAGLQHLSNWPVSFGTAARADCSRKGRARCLYIQLASQLWNGRTSQLLLQGQSSLSL